MDANLYEEAIEYEHLTQAIYRAILLEEGGSNAQVQHNVKVMGRSGVEHQIDVIWRFVQAGVRHTVLVECKNYSSAITLEKVRNFFAVAHDIGNCQAIMVTKTGYQKGASEFAQYYGIYLKLIRKPTEADWNGRIKDIKLEIGVRSVVSTEERPVKVQVWLSPHDTAQEARLRDCVTAGASSLVLGPRDCLLDGNGVPATDELSWWLPKQLDVLEKEPGGPYRQRIPLNDKFLVLRTSESQEELVQVGGLVVDYYVDHFNGTEVAIDGEQIVRAILKDFLTGEVEHVLHKE